jgi:hypothetical protein
VVGSQQQDERITQQSAGIPESDARTSKRSNSLEIMAYGRRSHPLNAKLFSGLFALALSAGYAMPLAAQEVLPFPPSRPAALQGGPCRS